MRPHPQSYESNMNKMKECAETWRHATEQAYTAAIELDDSVSVADFACTYRI